MSAVMNPKHSIATCEQTAFNPDLSHHYALMDQYPDVSNLYETLDYKTDTAIGIVELLETQYTHGIDTKLSSNTILSAITAVEDENDDCVALIIGFYEFSRASDQYRKQHQKQEISECLLPENISTLTLNLMQRIAQMAKRTVNALNIVKAMHENIQVLDINHKVIAAALESAKEEFLHMKETVFEFNEKIKLQA